MDELKRKWLTVIFMAIAIAGAVFWSLKDLPANFWQTPIAGAFDAGTLGAAMVHAIVPIVIAWAIASAAAGLMQGRFWAWRAGIFLPVVIVAVYALDGGILTFYQQTPGARDSSAVQKLNDDFISQAAADREAYLNGLYALGYPDFLQPASLGAPNGLEHARDKIKKVRAMVKEQREHYDLKMSEYRLAVEKVIAREPDSRKDILAAFETKLKNTNADRLRVWQLQDEAMAEYQNMLDDLAASRDDWHTDWNKIIFDRHRDLVRFNNHIQTGTKLEKEAKALVDKVEAESKRQPAE